MIGRLRILFIFSIIGVLMLTQALMNISRIHNSGDWKQTEATVKCIKIERIKKESGDQFYPKIEYKYNLNGNLYIGDKLSFESGIAYQDEYSAKLAGKEFLKGKNEIEVNYNPKNPKESTILKGEIKNEYSLLFGGMFLITVGIFLNWKLLNEKIKAFSNKLLKKGAT